MNKDYRLDWTLSIAHPLRHVPYVADVAINKSVLMIEDEIINLILIFLTFLKLTKRFPTIQTRTNSPASAI